MAVLAGRDGADLSDAATEHTLVLTMASLKSDGPWAVLGPVTALVVAGD